VLLPAAGDECDVQELFPEATLEQLLMACPSKDAEQCVWCIAEHLPCLKAAQHMLISRMQLLAAGELLPATAAAAPTMGSTGSADTAALLASLAASSAGPKLAATLCAALGLNWPGTDSTHEPVGVAPAGQLSSSNFDDICCHACANSDPEDKLLLCDGCDAAYHMHCLAPALAAVPETDWFCPRCCKEIRSSK
jgi:hypothetical protein